jgi:hypothetical protein
MDDVKQKERLQSEKKLLSKLRHAFDLFKIFIEWKSGVRVDSATCNNRMSTNTEK